MSRRLAFDNTRRSEAVNGTLDIWQRGASFTATGYTADQWAINSLGTGGAATISRQAFTLGQADVPGEPDYYLSWNQTTTATTSPVLSHRIEYVDTLAGTPAIWSFYARSSATASCTFRIAQSFGTGGSPSSDVNVDTPLILTPGWRRYSVSQTLASVSGKTLGSNSNDQIVTSLRLPTNELFTVDLAMLLVERGIAAGPVVRPPIGQTLRDCWRFYWKSFALATAPAQNAGFVGALSTTGTGSGQFRFNQRLPVSMRSSPTLTTYNPAAANAEARNATDATDSPVTSGGAASADYIDLGVSVLDATDANDTMRLHVTADASLP